MESPESGHFKGTEIVALNQPRSCWILSCSHSRHLMASGLTAALAWSWCSRQVQVGLSFPAPHSSPIGATTNRPADAAVALLRHKDSLGVGMQFLNIFIPPLAKHQNELCNGITVTTEAVLKCKNIDFQKTTTPETVEI